MHRTHLHARGHRIHLPRLTPQNDGIRRHTPPPGSAFRPGKGRGSYRRREKFGTEG